MAGWVERTTVWRSGDGEPLQVAVALLDPETWEAEAEVTEPVGPFHPLEEQTSRCALQALALRGYYQPPLFSTSS